jgi:hypothetical protein
MRRAAILALCALPACTPASPPAAEDLAQIADLVAPADAGAGNATSPDLAPSRPLDPLEELFQRAFSPRTGPFANPAAAAYHCLAAASAYRRAQQGAAFSSEFTGKLQRATRASADFLVQGAGRWGGLGWGLDDPWDAFGDGTTNPATTVYAFQTGLAIWCLAEAAAVTGERAYRNLAVRAQAAYRQRAYVRHGQGYPIDCTSCGYFWYSLSANDAGRFVKNTNIEMAVSGLALDRYQASPADREAGMAAAFSQLGEIRTYQNYGYLGRYDRGYTAAGSKSFDDHNSFEAYLLLRAGELLGRADLTEAAAVHYRAYAAKGSEAYVAYAACHFARRLPDAARTCTAWVEAHGATNPAGIGLVMDYR